MIKMKALRAFGVRGANEGKIKRSREFSVLNEQRARDLEDHGLAFRLEAKSAPKPLVKMESAPLNKVSAAGPLDSPGGAIGADAPVPSSPPVPRRRGRPPKASAEPARPDDLLSSQ